MKDPEMDPDLNSLESNRGGVGEVREEEGEDEMEGESPHSPILIPEEYSPPDSSDLVKIILLGAPAVGKTSIVQQFVWNDFKEMYYPTDRRHSYYPSIIINGRFYETKISDLPPVPYFPVDSLLEWADFPSYGLRTATAYVLVFDLSNAADTFRHIKCLREQMAGSRDMRNVPVVVVGNKHDRLHDRVNAVVQHPPGSFFGMPCLSSGFGPSSASFSLPVNDSCQDEQNYVLTHTSQSALLQQQQKLRTQQEQNALALEEIRERRNIANIVRKHWRCSYVECSAKYNWKVVSIFKELMQAVDTNEGRRSSHNGSHCLKENENLYPEVEIVRNKEVLEDVHLNRHPRTPTVVDEFQDILSRSRCDVL